MRLRKKTVVRIVLAAAALIVAIGLIAPRLDAHRFRERVKTSLRAALGREVDVGGEVRLDLFNGPGFSVDKVVVFDDPKVGLEPFAYVESLEARVSFASFWTGRLEFSNLRLLNASINLARPEGGHWNFESLLGRTAGATAARDVRLPQIEVRSSRINFRFGETKSVFYLAEARLDATPPSSPSGDWRVRFEGEPARTDRGSQGFGSFTAAGRWHPGGAENGRIDVRIELENGSLSDLIRLAHGHDIGVHGHIGSRARLVGPPSNIRIDGRMQIGDFHRWDLMPPHTDGWPLEYHGTLDLIGQTLWLETTSTDTTRPVQVQLRATGFLSRPRWATLVKLDRLSLTPLTEIARHMGLALPEKLAAAGELSGIVGYTPETGIQGMLGAGNAVVTVPDSPPLRLENALVRLDRDAAHLEPAAFTAGGQAATLEGEYGWAKESWGARITAEEMALAPASAGARLLGSVPLVEHCTRGNWNGQLDYRKEGEQPGRWTGVFRIVNASLPVDGVADPLEIISARVFLREDGFTVDHLRARAGAAELTGEYQYVPAAEHPHQLRLSIPKLTAEELERLLLPSLRRDETLLSRALRLE
ncbi:MAG TPA: AsmA family protein, partial [Bryobacteraceae bacterium]|nr:AsmA family protein [Bryobacteraceae bacterium]